jgi:hypothetical protein
MARDTLRRQPKSTENRRDRDKPSESLHHSRHLLIGAGAIDLFQLLKVSEDRLSLKNSFDGIDPVNPVFFKVGNLSPG